MYQKLFALQEEVFKVIANQKRLEIIQLVDARELTVTEMVEMLGIPQANLSQHLALLRQAGVVQTRRAGVKVFYSLSDPRIGEAISLVRSFLAAQHRFDPAISKVLSRKQLYPLVKDPVCGMRLSHSDAGDSSSYQGQTYYFCASGCRAKFEKSPERYIKAASKVVS